MRIIINVKESFSKENMIDYLKCINIDDELIDGIKFEE